MDNKFTKIVLPAFIVADWFKNHLVEQKPANLPIKEIKTTNENIGFLGNNKQHIVFIVNEKNGVFISDNNLVLLEKLLVACKLSLADVAIVNQANNLVDYKLIKQQLNPATLVLLGVEPTSIKLPLVFPMHKIQMYDNCKMLISISLDRMQLTTNAEVLTEKKEFWGLLKQIFNL